MVAVDMMQTARNIDELRIKHGMTIKDMCDAVGVGTVQSVYKWIHGKNLPTIDNLVIIASLFGVKLDDIVATKGE